MIDFKFPGKFMSDTKSGYTWIDHGMTPMQARWEAERRLRMKSLPSSPERKKRKYEEIPEEERS
jgi:hypothetical protein